jgi:hypothetical protein
MINRSKLLLKRIILILLGFSLLLGLAPLTDTDFDGALESFLAGTELMIPAIWGMALSFILISLSHSIHLIPRPPYYFLHVPPPIQ